MNDHQFVNIVNNNTDSEINTYLQTVLSQWMVLAVDYYRDIEMVKKIATVFEPKKIDACMLMNPELLYLTNYFQQRFHHRIDHNCTQNSLLKH